MRIRTPSRIELPVQILLGALLALVLVDFFQAPGATACTVPDPSPNCYPWGATEGPMDGGSWGYSSKANYLIASGAGMFVLALAALAPFFARGTWNGLISLVGILALGRIGFWLVAG